MVNKRRNRHVVESEAPALYRVVPEAPRIKALIYGESGVGKTTLAATAQDHQNLAPILFANIEGGLLSVAHRKDVHAVDVGSTEQLYDLYRALRANEPPFDAIATVIVDNITEL